MQAPIEDADAYPGSTGRAATRTDAMAANGTKQTHRRRRVDDRSTDKSGHPPPLCRRST